MGREYFHAYHSYLEAMEPLTDEERGRLFAALLAYSATGRAPELWGNERFVFPTMRQQIDRDARAYREKCEKNRRNGALGGKSERCPSPPKEKEKEKAKEKKKEKEKEEEGFCPPTLDQVEDYCHGRHSPVDAQRFIDFYTANGWRVGSNPMRDWKAALRTWERRSAPVGNPFLQEEL